MWDDEYLKSLRDDLLRDDAEIRRFRQKRDAAKGHGEAPEPAGDNIPPRADAFWDGYPWLGDIGRAQAGSQSGGDEYRSAVSFTG